MDMLVLNKNKMRMVSLLPMLLLLQLLVGAAVAQQQIPLSTVAQHDDPSNDCWIVYHNYVFDMTTYRHPRNLQSVIRNGCGKDSTEQFSSIHPRSYLDQIADRKLGELGEDPIPTSPPTEHPTSPPTESPTEPPTEKPTEPPTEKPTEPPTEKPKEPTTAPTTQPTTLSATAAPTPSPTTGPTTSPTRSPTVSTAPQPTTGPTATPTSVSTVSPTASPTEMATVDPTAAPARTENPTEPPTEKPTDPPTSLPTEYPIKPATEPPIPTIPPTRNPTNSPTASTPHPQNAGIPMSVVAEHATPDDCWIIYHKSVYNMSTYRHPRNLQSVITNGCGRDSTEQFSSVHPISYLAFIESHKVGDLADEPSTTSAPSRLTNAPTERNVTRPSVTAAPTTPQGITIEELAQHSSPEDCWVAFFENVYEMTDYAPNHPGPGASVIYQVCGMDGTSAYETAHNEALLSIVENTIVGSFQKPLTPKPEGGITLEELALHNNSESDCWIAYYYNVYDMTLYSEKHPGGKNLILDGCGTDDTIRFAKYHLNERDDVLDLVADAEQGFLIGASYPDHLTSASVASLVLFPFISVVLILFGQYE